MTTPPNAPHAEVIKHNHKNVTIRCPYCNGQHRHDHGGARPGLTIRRAPGCGLYQSAHARMTGYRITLPEGR